MDRMVMEKNADASVMSENFSSLVVGTAQFGMPYGIGNRRGQPSFSEVCDILRCAIDNGATTFDTAVAYGESEEILGRALSELRAHNQATVITKVPSVSSAGASPTPSAATAWIRETIETSLKRLRLEQLPLCLFHDADDIVHMEALLSLKAAGLVRHVGVSVARPDQLDAVLTTPGVEAIQVAASLLDQRILRSGSLTRAAEAGMAVFIRSVYLQGLVLMPESDIAGDLREVIPIRRELEALASDAGMPMAELALRYALSLPGVTGILTGVETPEQMAQNTAIARRGRLDDSMMRQIAESVPELSETILFPLHWPNAWRPEPDPGN
jgi:aryl-alcohol dehydrogenase-like predicted oxidoreductase